MNTQDISLFDFIDIHKYIFVNLIFGALCRFEEYDDVKEFNIIVKDTEIENLSEIHIHLVLSKNNFDILNCVHVDKISNKIAYISIYTRKDISLLNVESLKYILINKIKSVLNNKTDKLYIDKELQQKFRTKYITGYNYKNVLKHDDFKSYDYYNLSFNLFIYLYNNNVLVFSPLLTRYVITSDLNNSLRKYEITINDKNVNIFYKLAIDHSGPLGGYTHFHNNKDFFIKLLKENNQTENLKEIIKNHCTSDIALRNYLSTL